MHAVNDAIRFASLSITKSRSDIGDAPIQICLFGGLTLLKCGTPVSWRGAPKTEAMLLSLAIQETRGVSRERLLTQLWPDTELALASQSLRSLMHQLHRLLGDAIDGAMPVVHAGDIYRLNLEAGIGVDISAFEALGRAADHAWQYGQWQAASDCYRRAIELYRGDLSAGSDDSAIVERERLRNSYLAMLGRLADLAWRENDYSSAVEYASLVLKYDAGREDAHRILMSCYAAVGQRVQAMRQYLLCERLLRETFDAVPEPSTRALYDRLRLDPASARMEP